jgi:ParB/RepB/Spo0J family partition protein
MAEIARLPVRELLIDELFNCRDSINPDSDSIKDLATDIKRQGLISPIVVAPLGPDRLAKHPNRKWLVVAGNRRTVAHKVAGLEFIDAIIREDLKDEKAARIVNISENVQRKDLSILEIARSLATLRSLGLSRQRMAKMIGKGDGYVQIRLMIWDLPNVIREQYANGSLKVGDTRTIYTVFRNQGAEEAIEAARRIKEGLSLKGSGRGNLADPARSRKNSKAIRNTAEIVHMQTLVREQMGNNIITQCFGWAGGYLSNQEFFEALEEYAADHTDKFGNPLSFVAPEAPETALESVQSMLKMDMGKAIREEGLNERGPNEN